MLGTTLAHYKILEKIGEGGMGEVYRAQDTKLGRDVALKLLAADVGENLARRTRFLREAKAVAVLQHPNIVTVHSVDEVDGKLFLTMELVGGKTLDEVIPTQGMRLVSLLQTAIPLADAVAYAHTQGISHRDLKPSNVMVDDRGHVRVLDFGLAKLLEEPTTEDEATMTAHEEATAEGQIVGTAAYMSPEQAQGLPVDARTDIFSLGVILYEMATGERPFRGDTRMSTISSVLKDEPARVTDINAGLPRQLARIIHKCLAKDPANRYQTAQDLRIDLAGLKEETESGVMESSVTRGAHAERYGGARRRFPVWIPVGAAVAVALGLVVWQMLQSGNPATGSATVSATSPVAATTTQTTPRRTMIAVLPFQNLGDAEDAYFAEGVTEELISMLAGVKELGVISRKSAARYAGSDLSVSEIGAELGVDYLVDGSIRWEKVGEGAGRVRVTPHLVRVEDGVQVWSDRYDEQVEAIFAVQSRLAEGIVEQVGLALTPGEGGRLDSEPLTDNFEAQQMYLKARSMSETGFLETKDYRQIIDLLKKAVELDPEFGEAWSLLSRRYSIDVLNARNTSEEHLALARRAADRAMEIDPGSVHGHLALGYYYYHGRRQYERAYEEFEKTGALESNPEVMDAAAYVLRRANRWEESITLAEAARVLDPGGSWDEMASTYHHLGRHEEELESERRWLALHPDDIGAWLRHAYTRASHAGDPEEWMRVRAESPQPDHVFWNMPGAHYATIQGDYEAALAHYRAIPIEVFDFPDFWMPRSLMEWDVLERLGREEEARTARADALDRIEVQVEERPDDWRVRICYAYALGLHGRREEALDQAQLAVDVMPVSRDALYGRTAFYDQALAKLNAGAIEASVAQLREILADPYSGVTRTQLSVDIRIHEARNHPVIKALLEESS